MKIGEEWFAILFLNLEFYLCLQVCFTLRTKGNQPLWQKWIKLLWLEH